MMDGYGTCGFCCLLCFFGVGRKEGGTRGAEREREKGQEGQEGTEGREGEEEKKIYCLIMGLPLELLLLLSALACSLALASADLDFFGGTLLQFFFFLDAGVSSDLDGFWMRGVRGRVGAGHLTLVFSLWFFFLDGRKRGELRGNSW